MTMSKDSIKNEAHKAETLGEFSKFGYYTIFFLIASELTLLPEVLNMTFMVYGGIVPTIKSCGRQNFTGLTKAESCELLVQNNTGCIPDLTADFASVGYEYKMYCEKSVELKGSISLFMFGSLLGSIVFGQLSDTLGRKRMLMISHVGMFIFDFFAAQTKTFTSFAFIQLFAMFFAGGHSSIMHVFLLENVPKRHRLWVTCVLTYSPNYVIASILAYFSHDWRTFLLITSAINVPAFCILLIAFESPRWMIQKGKLDEARLTLRKIEKINGTSTKERLQLLDELIQEERQTIETQQRKARKYYFYHLFDGGLKMTIHTLVISFSLVCLSIICFAVAFNLEYLSGSVYLNMIIYGTFRYIINICVGIVDFKVPKLGRKPINNLFLSVILLLLGIAIFIKLFAIENAMILVRFCALFAAGSGSQLYMVNSVITSELFPTAIRNVANSFVQLFSRIGGILAPHLFYLAIFWDPLPFIIMFLFIIVNMLLFIAFIPETKNCALIDHFPEKRERFFRNGKPLLSNKLLEIPPKNSSAAGLVDDL